VKVFIAAVVALLCLLGCIGVAVYLSGRALRDSEQALCPIVRLALAHPVPYPKDPKANPARVAAWQSYEDFLIIDRKYHC
jgi:hypothetical protein